MVCTRCARLSTPTSLATASIKRKEDSQTSTGIAYTSKASASGPSGIGKSKLLSKAAKNPYAAYAASCETCKVKINQGHKYCQKCAYKRAECARCGKKEKAAASTTGLVEGKKFSAK